MEALSQLKTIAEIASTYKLHPSQVAKWKSQLKNNAEALFTDGRQKQRESKNSEEVNDELYQQIGKLKVELDWMKKKVGFEA